MTINDAMGFALDHPTLVSSGGFFLSGLLLGYLAGRRGNRKSRENHIAGQRIEPRF
ncbi:hypothetical protein D3C87_2145930 [compost metagenome]